MPIPAKKFKIKLTKQTPTELTTEGLRAQLNAVGLTCEHTQPRLLSRYIREVRKQLPRGATESFGILKPGGDRAAGPFAAIQGFSLAANGNWEPDPTAIGYAADLHYIQFEPHFEWLRANRPSFTGTRADPPPYTGRYDSVQAIKDLFVKIATTASSTLVRGLDEAAMEAALSNIIDPISDDQAKDYDVSDSRVIFLVDNYDPVTEEADGVGVLHIGWRLTIKDYKEKKDDPKHDTSLTIHAWSVVYGDLATMKADLAAAKAHFGDALLLTGIPPKPRSKLKIFDSLPAAGEETFRQSLPLHASGNVLDAIVLYAPDLEQIGAIDNSASEAATTYTRAVTTGFTFSMSQAFSKQAHFEATAGVVKAGVTVGFTVSFTESWSKTVTETISFSVPAGQMAFTYQGYLNAATLRYDPSNDSYKYVERARCLINTLVTRAEPLIEA